MSLRSPYDHSKGLSFNIATKYFYNEDNSKFFNFKTEKQKGYIKDILLLRNIQPRFIFNYSDVLKISLVCAEYINDNYSDILKSLIESIPSKIKDINDKLLELYDSLIGKSYLNQLSIYCDISNYLTTLNSFGAYKTWIDTLLTLSSDLISDNKIETIKSLFTSFIINSDKAVLIISKFNNNNYDLTSSIFNSSIQITRNYKKMEYPFSLIIR
jgi:hypothetical protein